MTESLSYPGGARRQTMGEEVLNAASHGVGAVLAILGTVLLIRKAMESGLLNVVSVAIFGGSMILLYLNSCLYHALPHSKGKRVFQVLDHCSIFLLILGTYTPICLVTLGGTLGLTLFGVNLACGLLGIVLNAISLKRWKKVSGGAGLPPDPAAPDHLGLCVPAAGGHRLHRGRGLLPPEGKALPPRYLALLRAGRYGAAFFHCVHQLLLTAERISRRRRQT